jgi:hypothetical protein
VSTRLKIAIVASAVAILSALPAVAQAAQFEGTVVSKDKAAKTFRLKQDQGGGTFTIKVTAKTKYQRIEGFGALKPGLKNVEAVATQNAKGRWIASKVEISGNSGGGGNGGGGGADDPPNHT